MILTGPKIYKEVLNKNIIIEPFKQEFLNPNSYDFTLGHTIKVYKNNNLDTKTPNQTETINLTSQGLILEPNKLYLGHTNEIVGSNMYVPIIRGKSSTGRLGLFIHITADLIDIGYKGKYTLMMHAVQPIKIFPNMKIGQVTFWQVIGDIKLYNGKYQGGTEPLESQIYKDFRH